MAPTNEVEEAAETLSVGETLTVGEADTAAFMDGAGGLAKVATIKIGALAARCGVSARTVRYYEERGLLAPPERSTGGARRYDDFDVARLSRIRELQELLGFDLNDISEILRCEDALAGMREEFHGDVDDDRRIQIVDEALSINDRLQSVVRAKQCSLAAMMEDLELTAARYRIRAQELRL